MFLIDKKHGERKACDGCHRVRVEIPRGELLCNGCRQADSRCAPCLTRVPGAAEPRPGYFILCENCERLRVRRGWLYIPPERVRRAI
jgi:hypothetical protein